MTLFIASQQYPWWQITQQQGRDWQAALPDVLSEVAAAGLSGWEPSFQTPDEVAPLADALAAQPLTMRSCYAGGELHAARADETIARITAIAEAARPYGAQVVVVNPDPIRWGGTENKTDEQLRVQAAALERLGRQLADRGMALAYHTHDPEMRAAAREFHHMLLGTDPRYVRLCLDAHWIYRGAENSLVALLDIAGLYGDRVALLHLRQSQGGVWAETCEQGDIDYPALAAILRERGAQPLLVLEQAIEAGTPSSMPHVEAYRRSRAYIERVFG